MGRPKKTDVKSVVKLNDNDKILYRQLTDYIQEVYLKTVGYEPPWALFMTQIKDIKTHYDINYDVILLVLKYMIQIEGIDITDRDTLGLVPYYVDRANKYIERYKEIRQSVKEFQHNEQVVAIKTQQSQRKHKKNEVFD